MPHPISRSIYQLSIAGYRLAIRVAARLGNRKAQALVAGHHALAHQEDLVTPEGTDCLWLHAASVGEFEQGRPILEAYRKAYPDHRIVLTFFSPSGYLARQNWAGADLVTYLPWDSPKRVNAWLDAVRPTLTIFVKYEFWHFHLRGLHERQIPTLLISARFREGQPFFRPWGGLFRQSLSYFNHLFLQEAGSQQLLKSIGLEENTTVAGDTRADRVLAVARESKPIPLAAAFAGSHPTLVIGSSWAEDMEVLLPIWEHYQDSWHWIVAPHEITETNLKALEKALGPSTLRYSKATMENVQEARVLIIDNIGMLSQLYAYGWAAYVGGAFGKGLHNTLEAAVYGIPVFFGGPNYRKFQEARDLLELGGAFTATTADAMMHLMAKYFWQPNDREQAGKVAHEYVAHNAGATEQIMQYIAAYYAR